MRGLYRVNRCRLLVWAVGFFRKSFKIRHGFVILGLEFYSNAPGEMLKRAEEPFRKSNGKCEVMFFIDFWLEIRLTLTCRSSLGLIRKAG
jgi:hypothetical protein